MGNSTALYVDEVVLNLGCQGSGGAQESGPQLPETEGCTALDHKDPMSWIRPYP